MSTLSDAYVSAILRAHRPPFLERVRCAWRHFDDVRIDGSRALSAIATSATRRASPLATLRAEISIFVYLAQSDEDERQQFVDALEVAAENGCNLARTPFSLVAAIAETLALLKCERLVAGLATVDRDNDLRRAHLFERQVQRVIDWHREGKMTSAETESWLRRSTRRMRRSFDTDLEDHAWSMAAE